MKKSPTNSRGNSRKNSQRISHKNPTSDSSSTVAANSSAAANMTSQKSSLKKLSEFKTKIAAESSDSSTAANSSAGTNMTSQKLSLKKLSEFKTITAAESSDSSTVANSSAGTNMTSQKLSLKKLSEFKTITASATAADSSTSDSSAGTNMTSQKLSLKKLSEFKTITAAESSDSSTAAESATAAKLFSAHPIKKLLAKVAITFSIIAISLMVTALSCQKKNLAKSGSGADSADTANNSSNNDTDNSGNTPNPKPKPIDLESFSSGNLQIEIATSNAFFIKRHTDGTLYINAEELEKKVDIVSDPQDDQRGFRDLVSKKNRTKIFSLYFPGHTPATPKVAMFFLFRPHVNKNTLTLDAPNACANNSESADNSLAEKPGGGICRSYTQGGVSIHLESFLGTAFNNTDTTRARGLVQCETDLQNIIDPINHVGAPIDDTTVFNRPNKMDCFLGVVNNGGIYKNQTLDSSWAHDKNSTPEVEFYAMGINITGKLISAWSIESGFNLSKFNEALDNVAIKKILKATDWRDRSFKVRIVSGPYFTLLFSP